MSQRHTTRHFAKLRVTPSASSLRRWRASGPEECNPAGGGVCGKKAARTRRSCKTRAGHVTQSVRGAPGPRVVLALIRPAGTPLRPPASAAPQPPPERTRRVGVSRRLSRLPRLALLESRSGGPHGPSLRETAGSPRRVWAASPRAQRGARPGPLEARGSTRAANFVRGERVLDVGENALLRGTGHLLTRSKSCRALPVGPWCAARGSGITL